MRYSGEVRPEEHAALVLAGWDRAAPKRYLYWSGDQMVAYCALVHETRRTGWVWQCVDYRRDQYGDQKVGALPECLAWFSANGSTPPSKT